MSSVNNYMSMCHKNMSTELRSTTIKGWNKRASMQSSQKVCYLAKDSVANGSIAIWTSSFK
jgi:hypothetical protein